MSLKDINRETIYLFIILVSVVCIVAILAYRFHSLINRPNKTHDITFNNDGETVAIDGVLYDKVEFPKRKEGWVLREGVPYVSGPNIETQDYKPGMEKARCEWTGDVDWPIACESFLEPRTLISKNLLYGIEELNKPTQENTE